MSLFTFVFQDNSALDWIQIIITPLLSVGFAWLVFIKQQEKEQGRWVNDVYARKEAEYWLDYRDKILDIKSKLFIFLSNIYSLDEVQDDTSVIGILSKSLPAKIKIRFQAINFQKRIEEVEFLTRLHLKMHIYFDKEGLEINTQDVIKVLYGIHTFYSMCLDFENEGLIRVSKKGIENPEQFKALLAYLHKDSEDIIIKMIHEMNKKVISHKKQ